MIELKDSISGPVVDYLNRSMTAERRTAALEHHRIDPEMFDEMAEQGWFGLIVPESSEGLGLHPSAMAPIFRTFGERLVGGPLLEQMLLPGLLLKISQDQAHKFDVTVEKRLREASDGKRKIAIADSRGAGLSSYANGELSFTEGRLTGALKLVRFGPRCDDVVVFANSGRSTVLLLVHARAEGVVWTDGMSADPGSQFAAVSFNEVEVSESCILLANQDAEEFSRSVEAWQRLFLACELAGASRYVLNLSVDYVKQREQFGRAVGSFQAVKHIAALAAQRVDMLENFCDAVADDSVDQSVDDFALAAASLKAYGSEMAMRVSEAALQMHGGIGFTYEYELHWYYKRVLALRCWYGDDQELAVEIGRTKLALRDDSARQKD